MSADRGQALVLTALLLGVAAAAVAGIAYASDGLLDGVREQRAGEAAAAAAGTRVADLQFARVRELGRELDASEIAAFAAEPAVVDAARVAADELARAHGRGPAQTRVRAIGYEIEVHVRLGGRAHIALLGSNP